MAEATNGAVPPSTPQTGEKAASFRILAQYIKDMSVENPNAPASLQPTEARPRLKIDANVAARKLGDNLYESTLTFEASANGPEDRLLYNIELTYAGVFRIEGVPEAGIQPILLINCPTLLYPFLRRIVADVTHEAGYPPLLLDPIDFHALYMRNAGRIGGNKPEPASA